MLQPEYKKDAYKSYMVLKEEQGKADYSMKMLANNRIKGFLELEIRFIDERKDYYYDVTEKQTMDLMFRKTALGEKQIKSILTEIIGTIKRSRDYLLLEDNFVLNPEYIYMNLDTSQINLVYFSGYEERVGEQLLRLIEYMMDKVDYKDKAAVYLIYGIYKVCRGESVTLDGILEYLHDSEVLEKDLDLMEMNEQEMKRQEELFLDVEEEIESEEEKKKYPLWVWLGCGISVLVSLGLIAMAANKGILFDLVTGEIMLGKMAAILGVIGILEAYCLLRLLDEKHKIACIEKKIEYVKPVEEKREEQATVVLAERGSGYVLLPEQKDMYMPIQIQEFPFFIGTLKTKVDYVINSRSVSRFHAKLEQEKEHFYLVDLNSTNGTFVNGVRLEPNERKEIALGDAISFADVVYRFYRE